MIIETLLELQIGQIVTGNLTDRNRQWHRTTMCVLRQATLADYHAQAIDYGIDVASLHDAPGAFYFEVSVD